MSHLRTMPRSLLNCGTSYGQVRTQYWQPMHWSSRWRTMPVDGILFVGLDRTAVHARRVEAVVAGGGDRLLHRRVARAAVQQADAAPGLVVVQPVQAVAGRDARLAARCRRPGRRGSRTARRPSAWPAGSAPRSSRRGRSPASWRLAKRSTAVRSRCRSRSSLTRTVFAGADIPLKMSDRRATRQRLKC